MAKSVFIKFKFKVHTIPGIGSMILICLENLNLILGTISKILFSSFHFIIVCVAAEILADLFGDLCSLSSLSGTK